jgi:C4-dicarboxylate-specific signal transduction histidine kinase
MDQLETGEVPEAAQAVSDLQNELAERQHGQLVTELAHANRVATLGQLSASIAHEVKQPIGVVSANAQAALRLLNRQPPMRARCRAPHSNIYEEALA